MQILLYDDHSFVTEAIAKHITENTNAEVVDQCHTIKEVMMSLKSNEVDILVSDVLSDEDSGFTIFEYVTKNYPETKVVVYTSISNIFIVQSLLEMGISGVVNKKESIAILWEYIQKIMEETKTTSKKNIPTILQLTKREKEIAILLSKGLSAKEISDTIGSSQNTINNQKNAMLEKFGCTNSTDLVVKLTQMGLIGIL
jgi:two-component system, NarL family, captular synthesis response regulator RcsB